MSLKMKLRKAEPQANKALDRARQAAEHLGPVARSARKTAAHRVRDARKWAAPRMEQAAQAVQDNVAPKVSAMLEATAQRIEPAQKEVKRVSRRARKRAERLAGKAGTSAAAVLAATKGKTAHRRRRWPKVVGLVAMIAAITGAISAVVRSKHCADATEGQGTMTEDESAETAGDDAVIESEAGVNGRVRSR